MRALRDSTSWLHRPRGLRRRFRSDGYLFAREVDDADPDGAGAALGDVLTLQAIAGSPATARTPSSAGT